MLVSCKKSCSVIPVLRGITFCAAVSYYNECYEGNATVDDDGNMSVTVTSPDTLNGLVLGFCGSSACAEYSGLEYKYDITAMPDGSAYSLLYEILSVAAESEVLDCSGEYIIEGKADGADFRLLLGGTGFPISAEIPSCGLTVEFKNASLIPGE